MENELPYFTQVNEPVELSKHPELVERLEIVCDDDYYNYSHQIVNNIWNKDNPCIVFRNIVKFTNIISAYFYSVSVETEYWIQFAKNCKRLKFLSLDLFEGKYSSDYFHFEEEAFESLMKIPTLEKVNLTFLRTDFFPKGSPTETGNEMMQKQSNIKDLKVAWWLNKYDSDEFDIKYPDGDYYTYGLSEEFVDSFARNIGTYIHLEKLEINIDIPDENTNDAILNSIIEGCPKLEYLSMISIINSCCKLETFIKLVNMPCMKSLSIYINDDGFEDIQLSLLEQSRLQKLEHLVINHFFTAKCPLYDQIFKILKEKCTIDFVFCEYNLFGRFRK